MIKDDTINLTIVELGRTMAALKALKAVRKGPVQCLDSVCSEFYKPVPADGPKGCASCGGDLYIVSHGIQQHAAAKRASMDLTRMLANLRAGR